MKRTRGETTQRLSNQKKAGDYLRFVFGVRVGGKKGKGKEGDVTNESERKKTSVFAYGITRT